MSSPLDRIEASVVRWCSDPAIPDSAIPASPDDVLALVAVARAAERRRDIQTAATHWLVYDPTCPCCIAQDEEWAALSRLGKDTAA